MAKLIYQAGFESEALDAAGGDSADTLGPMQLTQGPEVPGSAIDKLTMLASPPRAEEQACPDSEERASPWQEGPSERSEWSASPREPLRSASPRGRRG